MVLSTAPHIQEAPRVQESTTTWGWGAEGLETPTQAMGSSTSGKAGAVGNVLLIHTTLG